MRIRRIVVALTVMCGLFSQITPAAAEPSTCSSTGVSAHAAGYASHLLPPEHRPLVYDASCSFVYGGGPIRWEVANVKPPVPSCVPIFNYCGPLPSDYAEIGVWAESPAGEWRYVGGCSADVVVGARCSGGITDPDVQVGETLHCVSFTRPSSLFALSASAYRCASGV